MQEEKSERRETTERLKVSKEEENTWKYDHMRMKRRKIRHKEEVNHSNKLQK
jgi:hypothetical protein